MPKRTPPDDKKILKLTEQPPTRARSRTKVVASAHTPKKRANRRRRDWNPTIRGLAVAALILELGLIVFANPYLRVTKVRIEGTQTLPPTQVFTEAHVPAHMNIFWMALRQPFVRRLDADPVVDHAKRRIKLPDTLVLQVWERQPYATLALDGQYFLLDNTGVPFRVLTKPYPGVPLVAPSGDTVMGKTLTPDQIALGEPLRTDWLSQSYQLIALLASDQNLATMKIKVDVHGNLCLNRKDNLQILLGQADSLPLKVGLVQEAVAADRGEIARRAAYIDVSSPEQPVWMPRSAALTPGRVREDRHFRQQ